MTRMTSQEHADGAGAALLSSPVRRAIVEALRDESVLADPAAQGLTAAQLAEHLGLHVTTVRFHLDQLEKAGLVVSHFTTVFGVGRPRKVYAAAARSSPPADNASHLQLLAGLLTESFGSGATPAEAGEEWVRAHLQLPDDGPATTPGAWLTKVGRLVDVLHDWGYEPELSTADGGRSCRVELAHCPFMDLARANSAVVCGIHEGLLRGVLEQQGEHDVEVELLPFVGPDLCHAHLSTRTDFRPPPTPDEEQP